MRFQYYILVIVLLDLLRSMKLRVRVDYTLVFAIVVVKVSIKFSRNKHTTTLITINVLYKKFAYLEKKYGIRKRTFLVGRRVVVALWSKLLLQQMRDDIKWQIIILSIFPLPTCLACLGPDWGAEIYWRMLHNFPILHCSLSKGMTCCWDELWFYPKTLDCAKKRHEKEWLSQITYC